MQDNMLPTPFIYMLVIPNGFFVVTVEITLADYQKKTHFNEKVILNLDS